jgi:DNA-binding response OmpR family regulator
VARRADLLAPPTVERARSVHFRGRTAIVPSTQGALVTTLVSRFGGTVSDPEIRALCERGGISTHGEAVKTAMRRLKQILAPLGLRLTRVRSAGYLLDRRE